LIEKLLATLIIQQPSVFVNISLSNSRFDAHNCAPSHKLGYLGSHSQRLAGCALERGEDGNAAFAEKSPRLKSQGPELGIYEFC
jgi:hypothetical protein